MWRSVTVVAVILGYFPFNSQTADQAKITAKDGHLVLQGAPGRNITLKPGARGFINVDTENLLSIVQMTKDNNRQIQTLHSDQTGGNFQQRLSALEQRINQRLDELSSQVDELNNKVNSATAAPPPQNNKFRRLKNRVDTLTNDVNNLKTLLTTNECSSNPCRNGGTCVDLYSGFTCRCPPTYTGTFCDDDVNECTEFAGTDQGCQNGATCHNYNGGFSCTCPPNFHGVRCTEKHDDCTGASDEALCGHGTCQNVARVQPGQPKYRCNCDIGWTTNGITPECNTDKNECNAGRSPCSTSPRVQCINTPGSFICGPCPAGYQGNGFTCNDIDECATNNGGCSQAPRVECMNTIGSRTCAPCPAGYNGDGQSCTYVGICNQNRGGCHPQALCSETGGGVMCTCPAGYHGSGMGPYGCILSGSPSGGCTPNPCFHGTCAVVGQGYQCTCYAGYTGSNCQTDINECQSNPCQNGGTCINQVNAYQCSCPDTHTGQNCQTPQQSCGGLLNGYANTLRYPHEEGQSAPHNVECTWQIRTAPSKILMVTVNNFNIESHPNCAFDSLKIFDGPNMQSPVLGTFCGTTLPMGGHFNSTHNQMILYFKSDHSVNSDGFQLSWTSADPVCGSSFVNQNHGTISSPGYPGQYPHNRDCVWTIQAPPGKKIQFTFGPVHIEHHPTCQYDYLLINDGLLETDNVLRRICDSSDPPPLLTTGSNARVYFHTDHSMNDNGFQIHFITLSGCGASYTADSGVIISPNYPNRYPHNSNCEWTVTVPDTEVISFNFTNMDIESHHNCQFDYVLVGEGPDENSNIHGRYCGGNIPAPFTTSGNQLYVQFRSDYSVTTTGFRAVWNVPCGGTFTETTGVLRSPYHPNPYPQNKECVYLITQPEGYIITLTFTSFDIESSYSGCAFDYLEVHDGASANADLIDSYCGTTAPQPIVSSGNSLWLKFKSDGSVQNHGFRATYEASEGPANSCGGTFTEATGTFHSPGHPSPYPQGANCTYTINVADGNVVRLTFTTFQLEDHTNCGWDYVQVFSVADDGTATTLGSNKYCGNSLPPTLTSNDHIMKVVFISDSSINHEGFSASYISLDASAACGGDFQQNTGVIQSPNYPQNYPHNRDCEWKITAPAGQQILLNFTDFALESHPNCNYDFVEIRNGGSAATPLIGKYCGTNAPPNIKSSSNQIYIRFKSDYTASAHGFQMMYDGTTTGCGGELTSPTGSIVSPNYPQAYHHNGECYWTITTSMGSGLHLIFTVFDLESGFGDCYYDYVQVLEGGPTGRELGKFCGQDIPPPIHTNKNKLFIKFRSDYSVSGTGFMIAYSSDCNNQLTDRSGAIESPNFPDPYPHNRDCTWTVETTRGNTLNGSFSHFDVEDHHNCAYDYVEIRDGNPPSDTQIGKYCGENTAQLPAPFATTTKKMTVHFVSDFIVAHNGFRLEYITNGCGADLRGSSGQFKSPNYPNQYPHGRTCIWKIETPVGTRVNLTIGDVDIEDHHSCSYDSLTIFGGPDEVSPQLGQICGQVAQSSLPQIHTSSGNHMLVKFYTDPVGTGRGFRASYSAAPNGCGGIISMASGGIHSRNYPQNYDSSTECEWVIKVAEGHSVVLNFTDFQIESHHACQWDYVAVYDGDSIENSTQLIKACGHGLPTPHVFRSTGNKMFIRMRTDSSVTAKGFYATFETGCGGHRNADTDGEIFSPGWPGNYRGLSNCTWIIEASQLTDKVTLTFTHIDLERSSNCEHDYIRVLEGNNVMAPQIDTYCGSTIPASITSATDALTVIFSSDAVIQRSGFRAIYTKSSSACGGDFTAEHGAFNSPGYPNSYPNNIECVWTITTSPGAKLQLSFSKFHLEDEANCNYDFVEIRNGNAAGELINRFCGTTIPTNMTSGRVLWVRFKSNEVNTGEGFMASYASVYGGEVTGTHGQIASPHYPRQYSDNFDASWIITVSSDKVVRVFFSAMSVEQDHTGGCTYDYVMLQDGALEPSKYCGYSLPPVTTSTGSQLTVTFHTDFVVSDGGFLLQWYAVPAPSSSGSTVEGCGGSLTASNAVQTFTSPGYPTGYAHNLDCRWYIQAPMGFNVKLNITSIDLEKHTHCLYDKITVYTGFWYYFRWWSRYYSTKYCGRDSENSIIQKNTNRLTVRFTTDGSQNRTGFSIDYSTACGGRFQNQAVGVIQSYGYPQNYEQNSVCVWRIIVSYGKTIQVTFHDFQIGSSSYCTNDYLQLHNGYWRGAPSLGKFCGSTLPVVNETTSSYMYIKFKSTSSTGKWNLTFSEVSVSCGGSKQLTDQVTSGEISSPNYPQNYPPNTECVWVIQAPAGRSIQLDFDQNFYLENHHNCQYDYVEVRDGGTSNADQILHHCGNSRPSTVKSTGSVMYVRFRSDQWDTRLGFKATYSIATCGGTLAATQGSLTSPNYPHSYSSNLDCVWKVEAPTGHFVTFNFENFQLESGVGNNCTNDYLEFREHNSTGDLLNRYCGSALPASLDSYDNDVYVRFHTNNQNNFNGFKVNFNASSEVCGGSLVGSFGTFTSPGYPHGLAHGRWCKWFITVPQGRRVKLMFTDFDLTTTSGHAGYVEVYSGHMWPYISYLGWFYGADLPNPVSSSGNKMLVTLWTYRAGDNKGFSAQYSSDESAVCGGYISSDNQTSGVITSPNFGNGTYPRRSLCTWNIESRLGANSTIVIDFTVMSIQNAYDPDCYYSFLTLKEGVDQNGKLIKRYCGNMTTIPRVLVPGNFLFAAFKSSSGMSGQWAGFKIQYSFKDCGGILTGDQGVITSPNYPNNYNSHDRCAWLIKVEEGARIKVNFTDFDLEHHARCQYDYINLYNGGNPDSPLYGNYCSANPPTPFTSQSNMIRLEFFSDFIVTRRGFRLEYWTETEGCGADLHTLTGTLQSPNYPVSYSPNMECVWRITLPAGYHVELQFTGSFHMEIQSPCTDFVQLSSIDSEGSKQTIGQFCGITRPAGQYRSSGNKMEVLFQTDGQNQDKGFQATYAKGCGSVYTGDAGTIISPGYPHQYDNNLNCIYQILVDPQKFIVLTFKPEYFQIKTWYMTSGSHSNCWRDYVSVYAGNSTTSPTLLNRYCGYQPPQPLKSLGAMTIHFRTNWYYQGTGWKAEYQASECGGVFTNDTGTIRTPTHPVDYHHNANCTWSITVQENRVVALKFNSFDLEAHSSCIYDSVSVYDGDTIDANKLIGTFCGSVVPDKIKTVSNKMLINFVSDSSEAGAGFTASYWTDYGVNQGCGGRKNASSGTFSSVDIDNNNKYEKDLNCTWLLSVPDNRIVKLHFNSFNVESGFNCRLDYVEVRDGMYPSDRLIGKYCGSSVPSDILASSNFLRVRFFSDDDIEKPGFEATFSAEEPVCTESLTATTSQKVLTSPNYPNNYDHGLNCRWTIDAPAGKQILVNFTDFNIENHANCQYDHLELKDFPLGQNGQSVHLCGPNNPAPFRSVGRTIQVNFVTDSTSSAKGFNLTYVISSCNRTYTGNSGRIRSPGWPGNYPTYAVCNIKVSAPSGFKVSLFFSSFYIEQHSNCVYDYLKIYNGSSNAATLLDTLCGATLPNPIFATGSSVYMEFRTDSSVQHPGYDITYLASNDTCGGDIYDTSGSFTSPNYPGSNPSTTECNWLITVPAHRQVQVQFTAFDIGPTGAADACSNNYVKLYNGGNEQASVVGTYCGTSTPDSYTGGRKLFVKYKSDASNTGTGFRIKFTS